jgi:hypothetical protein
MSGICNYGCETAEDCTGDCHPPTPARTGKRCKWCDQGVRLNGTDHWIVKSIIPARIDIRPCAALAQAEGR